MNAQVLTPTNVALSARKGKVIVRTGKGGTYREVALNAEAREALAAWLTERRQRFPNPDEPAVFLNPGGRRLSIRSIDLAAKPLQYLIVPKRECRYCRRPVKAVPRSYIQVILLDLHDQDEYRAGHLPHARHIGLKDLAMRVDELPGDRPILAYCRGPYCISALKGITLLRELGIPAQRLPFGVPEWKAAGLPLDDISLAN